MRKYAIFLVLAGMAAAVFFFYSPSLIPAVSGPRILRSNGFDFTLHRAYVHEAREKKPPVIFFGDSHTYHWDKGVWDRYFVPLGAAKFGIGNQTTEHLLWRIQHGEIGSKPKVVVLLIGANDINTGSTPAEVAKQVDYIVRSIHKQSPQTHILLMALFQRGNKNDPFRAKTVAANALLRQQEDVTFIDISEQFVTAEDSSNPSLGQDGVHLNEHGYELWAQAVEPKIKELLTENGQDQPGTRPAH